MAKKQPTKLFNGDVTKIIRAPKNKNDVKQVANFMANLIRYQRTLFKKELEDFNRARAIALNAANPRRYQLMQHYYDISLDLFIKGQVNQRIGRITNKRFKIVNKTGEKNEEKTKLLQKKWFKKIRKCYMEHKMHGFAVPYLYVNEKGKLICKAVPPENIIPEKNLLLLNPFDTDGFSLSESPLSDFCLPVGEPEDLGLFEPIAIAYILKKHSWQSWDEFEERFSIPMIIAKTASEDKAVQDEILGWLDDLGAGGNAVFPQETEIDYKEAKTNDAFQVFNEKRKALNEEVAILLNGHNEVANSGGSRAKSEALIAATTDQITEDDKSDFESWANDDLLPMLRDTFGFALSEDDKFEWDDADILPITEMAEVLKKVDEMGFELDAEDVSSKLGVKIIGKKQPVIINPNPEPQPKKPAKNKIEAIFNMHKDIAELLTEHNHG